MKVMLILSNLFSVVYLFSHSFCVILWLMSSKKNLSVLKWRFSIWIADKSCWVFFVGIVSTSNTNRLSNTCFDKYSIGLTIFFLLFYSWLFMSEGKDAGLKFQLNTILTIHRLSWPIFFLRALPIVKIQRSNTKNCYSVIQEIFVYPESFPLKEK